MQQETPGRDFTKRLIRNPILWVVLGSGTFLYLETFLLPFTPRAATGDQSIYLHDAARMMDGEMIYRDYDHFTLPGTDVVYLTMFKMFGIRAWIPEAMLILIGSSIAGLSRKISATLLNGAARLLPGFLFLVLPFTGYLDATHHWYSILFAIAAVALLIEHRTTSRVAWAGVLWGLSTCFAQSMVLGPIGLGLFLMWEQRGKKAPQSLWLKECSLFATYLAVVLSFTGYFAWKAGIRSLWYETVIFVAKYYPTDDFNTWRAYMKWRPSLHVWTDWPEFPAWMLIHFILPLVYILFFVRYRREMRLRPEIPWEGLMLVNFTGISMFLMVASAPAANRLYTVSLPALILLVWLLDTRSALERVLLRGLWVTVVLLALIKPVVTQMRWKASLNLPTGNVAFFNHALYDKTRWLLQRTQPGGYFFGDQFVNFALRLRNPGRIAFIVPTDYTRPDEVDDLVKGLERHEVRFVSWYPDLDSVPRDRQGNNLAPLRRDLREHYRVTETFSSGDKIWERDNGPD
jgi:hypothetical protein